MSSGLQTLVCPHCRQNTEVIPGTMIAECDACHRLFRPSEAVAPASSSSSSLSSPALPPPESGLPAFPESPLLPPRGEASWNAPFDARAPSENGAEDFRIGQSPVSAASSRKSALAVERMRFLRLLHQRMEELRWEVPGTGKDDFQVRNLEIARRDGNPPRPPSGLVPGAPRTSSSSLSIVIFFVLLGLSIVGYILARQSDQEKRVQTRAPVSAPARPAPPSSTPPDAPARGRTLTSSQTLGKRYMEQGKRLTQEELQRVRALVELAREKNFFHWGFADARVQVVLFAPLTHMGIARLKQLDKILQTMAAFRNDAQLWVIFHWGGTDPGSQVGADWVYLVSQTRDAGKLHAFLASLAKDTKWRVSSMQTEAIRNYLAELQLSMEELDAQRTERGLEPARQQIMDVVKALELNENDFSFVINDLKFNEGITLYRLNKIIDYLLAEEAQGGKEQ